MQETLHYLHHIFLVIFGLVFIVGFNFMHGSKVKIFKALEYFQQNKDFTYGSFTDFYFGIFNSFYIYVPIPPEKKHREFYKIDVVKTLKKDYKKNRKFMLIYSLFFALYIAVYLIREF